jgi:hypothetical protein
MIKGFLNVPWFVWAALALVVAGIYAFVWPQKAVTVTTGFRFFVLRWGHSLTWLLLALNFLLRGVSQSWNGVANLIALTGGLMYILFIVMAFVVK